jgi:amino acid adenylation domain-containing protein
MPEQGEPRVILEHVASPAQQRLWFIEQMTPGAPVHNICVEVELEADLEPETLAAALDDVVERHEALRTVFRSERGELRQVIMSELAATPFRMCDLRSPDPVAAEAAWQTLRREESRAPFDLEAGPMLRLVLARSTDKHYRLVIVVHHMVADGLSFEIFSRDLLTAYRARLAGAAPKFDPLPVQYADFTEWQQQRLSTAEAVADLDYWRDQLADLPTIDLTRGRARPSDIGHDGGEIAVRVSAETIEMLRRESARQGGTLFMAFAALWAEAVGRWFGSTDVPIGTPIAGRPISEVMDVIGLFVDRAVLRLDTSGRPSFRRMLARTRDVVIAANDHSAVTFEQVVASVQPERRLGVTPLFQVGINLVPLTEISGGQFTNGTVRHDLNLDLLPLTDGLTAKVEFRHGVVDKADAEGVADLFERLLAHTVKDPDAPLRTAPVRLGAGESIRVGGTVDSAETTVYQAFLTQATRTPDATALVTATAQLSYREIAERAAALAAELATHGVAAEVPVVLALPRRAELIIAMLGVLAAGGAYVPVDPAAPNRHIERVASVGARVALIAPDVTVSLPPHLTAVTVDLSAPTPPTRWTEPVAHVDPANAAYVLYTSGTTGTPKGVVVEHHQVLAYARAIGALIGAGAGESYLMVQPPTFDSCVTQIYGALLSGGVLHLVDEDMARDAEGLADYCAKHPIDVLKIVPSHLSALLTSGRPELRPARAAIIGGEGSTREFVGGLVQAGWPVIGHYGPTETTVGVLAHWLVEDAFAYGPRTPLGPPIAGVRAYVLDEALDPVAPGGAGELYIGGDLVARGYAAQGGRTAEAFLPDPFTTESGRRMYRTGDVVRPLPNGGYEFLGRVDRQVKVSGHRIEPAAVEETLERHPGVRQAVAVVRAGRLVAYVALAAGASGLGEASLREHLAAELPSDSVPAAILIVAELPRKSNGKLDVDALPDPVAFRTSTPVPPETATEAALATIVAAVLDEIEVSITDRFFDLGGDSIRAIQLASLARQAGIALSVQDVFTHQTVRELAAHVDAGTTRPAQSLREARRWWSALLGEMTPLALSGPVGTSSAKIPSDVLAALAGPAHAAYGTMDADLLLAAAIAALADDSAHTGIGAWIAADGLAVPAVVVLTGREPDELIRAAKSAARLSTDRRAEWVALADDPELDALPRPDIVIGVEPDSAAPEVKGSALVIECRDGELAVRGPMTADVIASHLDTLVRHCMLTAPSYAAEDFPDAGLDGDQLARVLANLGVEGGRQ